LQGTDNVALELGEPLNNCSIAGDYAVIPLGEIINTGSNYDKITGKAIGDKKK
jgi:hypothetical protein